MSAVEPAIFEIAIQRGEMDQLLIVSLLLANSVIKPGSKLEKDVVIWYLKNRCQYSTK